MQTPRIEIENPSKKDIKKLKDAASRFEKKGNRAIGYFRYESEAERFWGDVSCDGRRELVYKDMD